MKTNYILIGIGIFFVYVAAAILFPPLPLNDDTIAILAVGAHLDFWIYLPILGLIVGGILTVADYYKCKPNRINVNNVCYPNY
jgi:hypothetical protein